MDILNNAWGIAYDHELLAPLLSGETTLNHLEREAWTEIYESGDHGAYLHLGEVSEAVLREAERINREAAWPGRMHHTLQAEYLERAEAIHAITAAHRDLRESAQHVILSATLHDLRASPRPIAV